MLEHKKIQNLSDYFVELNSRREKGVYFYRINGYSEEVGEFIKKYYDTARRTGVVIEGKIPNPDEGNLAYYNEIMGMDFQMSMDFIHVSLRKWLPRMNEFQRQNVAASIYDSLDSLRKAGKTENMLRNAYIKFMCWLYYKFERIVNQLGENHIPKLWKAYCDGIHERLGKKVKAPDDYREVKDRVVTDYRNCLEKQWITRLRRPCPQDMSS